MHVDYVLADYTRSEAYLTMLPALNSGKIELLTIGALSPSSAGWSEERHVLEGTPSITNGVQKMTSLTRPRWR